MSERRLKISKTLTLSEEAVTHTFGLLSVRGAGKTNAARVMAEEMFKAGLPFVTVTPVPAWWGLRCGKDGSAEGGLPVPIFGGPRGDVPLERNGGELVADAIVDQNLSCVVDLSDFDSEVAKKTFLLAFARRLYAKNRDARHLFLEEADDYIPQRPMRDEAQLLRAWENIVRRGRAKGLGCTLITQRSAAVNKTVLTQVETLFVMRTTGPHDRKAVEEWVTHNDSGVSRADMRSLPSLKTGEAWAWSPTLLGGSRRFRFRLSNTFDSGATPKATRRGRRKVATTLADVDLEGLRDRMAAVVERAKAEDPRELKKQIAKLERDKVELTKQLERATELAKGPAVFKVPAGTLTPDLLSTLRRDAVASLGAAFDRAGVAKGGVPKTRQLTSEARQQVVPAPERESSTRASVRPVGKSAPPGLGNTGLRRMLAVLAQHGRPLGKAALALRVGMSAKGGSFGTYLSRGRTEGWLEGGREVAITPVGLEALGDYEPLPIGANLLDWWCGELGNSGAMRMLRVLEGAWLVEQLQGLSKAELAERAEMSSKGGSFGTYLSRLKTLGLVRVEAGEVRLSNELVD